MQNRMRNGIFMAPFHPVDEDPTMALARDLELVEWLDRLGYDEAWIGEHHSAGFEIIASPELFIAAVAERTRHIRLGTGVVSLPYHNPLMTANRIIQLDHMTRGRVMFGAGPGLLPSDASMLGIDPSTQRDRMAEALDVILRLFAGETVSETTEWYTLNEARLHLLPYSDPYPEVAVASSITPSGGRLAGKYDLGMLCVAATQAGGFDALGENWKIANEIAQETRGKPMDPRRLRLVGPVHIAETREKARENVQFGIHKWLDYFSRINPTSSAQVDNRGGDPVDTMIASGSAVIGTPDDAVAQIRRLQDKQGEFGCFLQLAHNWADFDSTKKSYELWQRYVMPQLTGANRNRDISLEWTTEHGERLMGGAMKAAMEMFEKHQKEQAAKAKEEAS
ncbi:MAG TPA: LLM class flavin-dependent oxidoreductase [Alphaproteobacteria bacterium]|nr:LLM class flavin-dependent oxidoreductase [Alphaproteobacteria bacterium]HBC52747.1 LLM class flavin-dependent oxidoreductase [Alphaproteobacteria bacterium]